MQTVETQRLRNTVEYLNSKTGSFFRPSSSSTQRPILARIREGYTDADFRAVIDEKAAQWLGNDTMERYLRPQTLFGNKFEAYLQEARRRAPGQPEKNGGTGGFRSAKELLE